MMRVGKTLAASATLAWVFVSAPLSAADISERALSGENYQCPRLAPEEPEALADYEKHACADYNLETGAIGVVPVGGAEQLPDDSAINSVDGNIMPLPLGVGNGVDPQPPGNPPVNDGPGTAPGNPGNQGGDPSTPDTEPKGNNGVGNGVDPQPPGNPPVNDGPGTAPGKPGNKGGAPSTTP